MKLVLVWYWKMWKVIHNVALWRWHEIVDIIEIWDNLTDIIWKEFDVLIDFTSPETALENIKFYAEHNIKAVVGTTWWYDYIDEVKELFQDSNGALLWASNFSIWVNIFREMIKNASQVMNHFDDYDVFWHEFHHNMKADSPSGTAITTANIILENIDRKSSLTTEALQRKITPEELHFSSTRWWTINWTHSVYFDSPFDNIQITHTAKTREWFAIWSVLWAEWLLDKKWYFEINNLMDTLMEHITKDN